MILNKLFKKLKIVILALTLSSTLFVSAVTPVHAQFGDISNLFNNFVTAVSDKTSSSLQGFAMNSLTYMVQGSLLTIIGCDKVKTPDCDKAYSKGAMGATTDMIAFMYVTPAASGIEYFASIIQDFGLIEPAYAQTGTGFTALAPLLPLWRVFRNLTYVLFVIVFLISGLAIMFRWKLNPQTVLTVQSALPRIVVALLLVTFSYAIAGLVIDFLYVIISLTALAFGSVGGNPALLQTQFTEEGGFWNLITALGGQVGLANVAQLGGRVGLATGLIAGAAGLITGGFVGMAGGAAGGALIGSLLVLLIFAIIVIYVLIRLFIQLLQSYIAIIMLIVFGPLQIALGVIPGMPGFGGWLKSLVGNVAVFAGVAAVLMLGITLSHNVTTTNLWRAPLLVGSGLMADNIAFFIGIGILLIVHQVPQAIRNAFGLRGLGLTPQVPGLIAGSPRLAGLQGAEMGIQRLEALGTGPGGPGTGTGFAASSARVLRRTFGLSR